MSSGWRRTNAVQVACSATGLRPWRPPRAAVSCLNFRNFTDSHRHCTQRRAGLRTDRAPRGPDRSPHARTHLRPAAGLHAVLPPVHGLPLDDRGCVLLFSLGAARTQLRHASGASRLSQGRHHRSLPQRGGEHTRDGRFTPAAELPGLRGHPRERRQYRQYPGHPR